MLFSAVCLGQAPPAYYATADGKSGSALKAALHLIIHGHTVIPYSSSTKFDTSDAIKVLDEAPNDPNSVILIYSGLTEPKDSFNTPTGWTREHLWCDSYGIDEIMPSYSDLHNLRAIDSNVNSSRSNDPYDDSDKTSPKYKAPAFAEAPGTSRDADSWEPPDNQKGDIARALFYMAVRYEGDATNEPDLELTDDLTTVTSTASYMGKLTTLILWSELDPVSSEEIARNNKVDTLYQHNRNPFIDHPEWVTAVFGDPLKLNATPVDGALVLTWSGALHRVVLQESTDLMTWTDYPVAPSGTQATTYTVTAPLVDAQHFFRLTVR